MPDRFARGLPFELYDFQFRYLANFYLVKPTVRWVPDNPVLGPAFVYRRGLLIDAQKRGKSPLTAAHICLEGAGPALFAGWAKGGEVYDCREHGCGCGWTYEYQPGEPMGMRWPTPLIQITAYSEDQPLALDTPVATPTGWSTVGRLAVGDAVFAADGSPVRVERTTPVLYGETCYEVEFSDGERIVASATHRWTMERRTLHGDRHERVTISTEELAATRETSASGARYRIPAGVAWHLPPVDLPVDPYLLGLWLGDGSRRDATVACDYRLKAEIETIVKPLLADHDEVVWRDGPGNQGTFRIRRRPGLCPWGHNYGDDVRWRSCGPCRRREARVSRCDSFRERLRLAGVLGNKHVPGLYLRASAQQRHDLLQGLMDSDGHLERNGRAIFSNADEVLVDGVTELLTSLGYRWSRRWCQIVKAWRVGFVPTSERPVARLSHKVARHRTADRKRLSAWRYVTSVSRVPSVPVRCIGINTDDHLFLAGRRAVPTHNTGNIYDALRPMIELGPLKKLIPKTGEEMTRLPGGGEINVVTSSAQSRLGQRITFAPQTEVGLWNKTNKMTRVADNQYRGLAGMGGRASLETNAFDPSEDSVAQQQYESKARDIYRQFAQPPAHLSYHNKRERRQIHRLVYGEVLTENGGHVDLDSIEAESADLAERDPAQAERFFGNRLVYGAGGFLDGARWDDRAFPLEVPDGAPVVLGMDGSDTDDWTVIRAETEDGFQFTPTYGPDKRPTIWNPAEFGGQVPRLEVAAAVDELMGRFQVARMYVDPPDWKTEIDDWAAEHGDKRVLRWETYRPVQMHAAAQRLYTDVTKAATPFWHDGCPVTARHVRHARKSPRPGLRYVLAKPSKAQKIDACVTSILTHEAACDVTAADLWPKPEVRQKLVVMRR